MEQLQESAPVLAAETGPTVGLAFGYSAPAAGCPTRAPQVFADPPAEPQLRLSDFWAQSFRLPARSIALFGL
jgi:hypothetical protein